MSIIKFKCCSKCREEKLFSEFHKDKNRKDGFYSICKQCILDYKKKYPWKVLRYHRNGRISVIEQSSKKKQ